MSKVTKVTKTIETEVKLRDLEQTAGIVALREFIDVEKRVHHVLVEDLKAEKEEQKGPGGLLDMLLGGNSMTRRGLDSLKTTRGALVSVCFPDLWDESESFSLDPESETLTFEKIVEETEDNTEKGE